MYRVEGAAGMGEGNLWQEELGLDSKTANTYGYQVQLKDFISVWFIFSFEKPFISRVKHLHGRLFKARSKFAAYLFPFVTTGSFTLKNVDEREG